MSKIDQSHQFIFDAAIIGDPGRGPSGSRPRARLTRRQIADVSVVLDSLIVCLSLAMAQGLYTLAVGAELGVGGSYTFVSVVAGLVHYLVTRASHGSIRQLRAGSAWGDFKLLAITFAIVIVMGYGLKQAEIHSRLWIGLSFVIAFTLILTKNRISHYLTGVGRLRELLVERIALVGEPSMAEALKGQLKGARESACEVRIYDVCAGGAHELRPLIFDGLNLAFDRIIFCVPPDQIGKVRGLVEAIGFLPARIEVSVAQAELQALHSDMLVSPCQILISVNDSPHDEWARLEKRALDVVLCSISILALSPLMILVAIAIKLESKGPVFFRQRRHGWNHSVFAIWKFRTMTVQEDGASIRQAKECDPRVTRVGRFLRRTSIDELPQLINVLIGEMSLVGPRPHALVHNMQYSAEIASYASRHKVLPGVTGWAQVNGLRGNCADVAKMAARADADLWYIRNWSIALDLKILLMTPIAVLLQKNAF